MLKRMERLLPHAAILICNMYIVFFLIDRVNTAMNFIDNGLTKGLLLLLCLVTLVNARWLLSAARPVPSRQTAQPLRRDPAVRPARPDAQAAYARRGDDRRLSAQPGANAPYGRAGAARRPRGQSYGGAESARRSAYAQNSERTRYGQPAPNGRGYSARRDGSYEREGGRR